MVFLNSKVSVIIPVYNGANFILEAIDSVLRQTHKDIEIIVIDDCSTDNTLAILATLESSITLLKLPQNQGASKARNIGMEQAKGQFIAFLDADDLWSPYFVETLGIELCRRPHYDLIYCLDNEIIMGEPTSLQSLKPVNYDVKAISLLDVFKNPYMATAAILFRTEMLKQVAVFDEDLHTAEDIDFILRSAEYKPILRLDQTLVEVRIRINGLGQTVTSYEANLIVITLFLSRNTSFYDEEHKTIDDIYENIYFSWLRTLLVKRYLAKFYKTSFIALRSYPSLRIIKLIIKSIIVVLSEIWR
jgi:glycosyltransferase involved in cell wall biosynthesis